MRYNMRVSISNKIAEVPLDHERLRGRDAADQHPIESITGLRDELDHKLPQLDDILPGALIVASDTGGIKCSRYKCDDLIKELKNKAELGHTHTVKDILDLQAYIVSIIDSITCTEEDITSFIVEKLDSVMVVLSPDDSAYTSKDGDIYIL